MSWLEKRRAKRLSILVPQGRALLRWKRRDYPALIIDQSANGFGIRVEPGLSIQVNDEAVLSCTGGKSGVRVTSRLDQKAFVQLGLWRVRDIHPRPPHPSGWLSLIAHPKIRSAARQRVVSVVRCVDHWRLDGWGVWLEAYAPTHASSTAVTRRPMLGSVEH